MPEQFLHGVEIIEVDDGTRQISTVKSSVIGLIGTAPDSAPAKFAALTVDNTLFFTAMVAGKAGNDITVRFKNPQTSTSSLTVAVVNTAITVSLATDDYGNIISTANDVINALTNNSLVTVVTGIGIGTVVVKAMSKALPLLGGMDEAFPLNTPVLIAGNRVEAAKLDIVGNKAGTLPDALDAIFDQVGAMVVVIRVDETTSNTEDSIIYQTISNIIGGVSAGGKRLGIQAFLDAETAVKVVPRILIVPGYSNYQQIVSECVPIADSLRAVIIADAPNTTDAEAISYRELFESRRVYVVDPFVSVWDTVCNAPMVQPSSARMAGVIAKSDNERGFWWSPSNREIVGILGADRHIDFALGDVNARANYLNSNEVATIVQKDGYRLWGNRTCSADPKYAFLSVVRTADMIHESLLQTHLWAVDRNITKTYIKDVTEGVNAYLRHLMSEGAIFGGQCWADPALNTPDQISQGIIYFDFDFTPPYPAEHIIFRSHLVTDYIKNLFTN